MNPTYKHGQPMAMVVKVLTNINKKKNLVIGFFLMQ